MDAAAGYTELGSSAASSSMQDYRRLKVWSKADHLALEVIAALTPTSCRIVPGLRAQAVRAAASIPDLLAEGCGKEGSAELARFAGMALGSCAELRNQLSRAVRIGIITRPVHTRLDDQVDEVRRMLTGLLQAVRRAIATSANT